MTATSTMSTGQVLAATHALSWDLPSSVSGQIRSHNHCKSKTLMPSKIHTQKFFEIMGTVTRATNNYQCEERDVSNLKTQNQLVFKIVAIIAPTVVPKNATGTEATAAAPAPR